MRTWKELISFLMDTPAEHWRYTGFTPNEHLVYEPAGSLRRVNVWHDQTNGWTMTLNGRGRGWYFHAGELSTPEMLADIEAMYHAKRGGLEKVQTVIDARVAYAMGTSDDHDACYMPASDSYQR
jgi:hypothetical protein